MISAVVFDLDDTLYPEKEFVVGGFREAGEELERILGRKVGASEVFLEILEKEGISKVFDKALNMLGIEISPAIIEKLVSAYRNHSPRLALFSGMMELLSQLQKKGLRLVLLTDGPVECQRAKVQALGISCFFEFIVYTHELGGRSCYKPCMAGFDKVEMLLGLSGPQILMVGDKPLVDLEPASKKGWKTVRVAYPGTFHANDEDVDKGRMVAKSVEELKRLIFAFL